MNIRRTEAWAVSIHVDREVKYSCTVQCTVTYARLIRKEVLSQVEYITVIYT